MGSPNGTANVVTHTKESPCAICCLTEPSLPALSQYDDDIMYYSRLRPLLHKQQTLLLHYARTRELDGVGPATAAAVPQAVGCIAHSGHHQGPESGKGHRNIGSTGIGSWPHRKHQQSRGNCKI